jgi:spore coat protein U domain-containing protein, fimbrial subunit CupE1/2/3/6
MKRILVGSCLALAISAFVLAARPARAGSATNTLDVTATVIGLCTIDHSALAFGNYDSSAAVTAQADITVHCTTGSSYWIGLGLGSNASGTTRQMASAGNLLPYELYRDAGFTQVWSNTDPAPTPPHSTAGNAGFSAYTTTVYGRIAANQFVPPGSYADSVLMTVNF